ncbi:MAG: hypothetical protein AVDCRST_MAG15-2592 [uncultured Rubellimicrobium sp.]|uniref:Uncharacterized protein n=1 Tax=uncultured Rubellimicrobium sp. TaxID=543078 RepID=A0A6J4PX49_9RHOB|nr:MAG: hypothetical protein AVDCRST_MAG15-2592 [uncultured Rubellimicrobium sp.]
MRPPKDRRDQGAQAAASGPRPVRGKVPVMRGRVSLAVLDGGSRRLTHRYPLRSTRQQASAPRRDAGPLA